MHRRNFIQNSSVAAVAFATGVLPSAAAAATDATAENHSLPTSPNAPAKKYRPLTKSGFGGVALGNGFQVNPDIECWQALDAA